MRKSVMMPLRRVDSSTMMSGMVEIEAPLASRFLSSSAELRMIPDWNPFDRWTWLQQHVGIQWIQFVPFVEVGRVAPEWNAEELHSDMQWDAGLGFRIMAQKAVLRLDMGASDEGAAVWAMVGNPF